MAQSHDSERVSIDDMTKGDTVTVHVNGRAWGHLGSETVRATVRYVGFTDVKLRTDDGTDMTVHGDTGYIMSHHDGLGRVSDIGKVRFFTR